MEEYYQSGVDGDEENAHYSEGTEGLRGVFWRLIERIKEDPNPEVTEMQKMEFLALRNDSGFEDLLREYNTYLDAFCTAKAVKEAPPDQKDVLRKQAMKLRFLDAQYHLDVSSRMERVMYSSYVTLGVVCQRNNDLRSAIFWFQKALSIFPDDLECQQALKATQAFLLSEMNVLGEEGH